MLNTLLSVPRSCDEIAEHLKSELPQSGLKVLQTFDLQYVRLDIEGCACPHHGTEECDCEMIVLLLYGSEPEPITLVLHGCDGQTQVALANEYHQKSKESFVLAIKHALADGNSIGLGTNV